MGWLVRRRKRKNCFHHDHREGTSWIRSMMIDLGMGKIFWCTRCDHSWKV